MYGGYLYIVYCGNVVCTRFQILEQWNEMVVYALCGNYVSILSIINNKISYEKL